MKIHHIFLNAIKKIICYEKQKKLIQFEFGWKVMKELLRYEGKGSANSGSPREILKAAYEVYDFIDEDVWLAMLKSRNDMTHIYDGESAKRLVNDILYRFIPEFVKLRENIEKQYEEVLPQL